MVDEFVIGATARELLMRPGFAGRVLAVVTGAVYLVCSEARSEAECRGAYATALSLRGILRTTGEILWLAQNHLPMHPRALRGDFDFSALRVGTAFQSDGARLEFVGAQLIAPLQNARVWRPALIDPARLAPRETVLARGKDLTGFRKPVRSTNDARDLIGLGEGLTPSGDDFVGGWLFAAYHLRAAYLDAFRWEQRAVDDLLEFARTRTNVISYALLRDHACGQSVEPLHDWIVAVLHGASAHEIESHARRVRAIGSTTGENLLAGAATAILSLADDRR